MHSFLKLSNFRFAVSQIIRLYSKNKQGPPYIKLLKTMPKDPKHIAEAQKQRIKIKQKSSRYSPGRVTLQVLGTGAKGAPRAVYLFSDQSRYLFNCGEGTQRLAHEHKTKLAKLEHIFITQSAWKNLGGLPGTALTIQDVGVPQITLHGPPGLNEIFPATRRFVVLRDLKINMAICNEHTVFEDNVMTVRYVSLVRNGATPVATDKDIQVQAEQNEASTSTRSEKRSRRRSSSRTRNNEEVIEDNTDYYAHEQSGTRTVPEHITKAVQSILIELKDKAPSMCYICRLQPRPGALNLDECVKKGVPAGPLLGKLKNGEDVTLQNGTVVKSREVCEPDDPGPIFLIIDCPSQEHIESLVGNSEFKKHQKFALNEEEVACLVVHFSPKDVMDLPEYIKWMDDFPPSTEHIFINETNTCMGSIAVHRIQYKLNMLSKDFFPLLTDGGTTSLVECSSQSKKAKFEEMDVTDVETNSISGGTNDTNGNTCRRIGTLSSFHLRPKRGFDSSTEIKLDPPEYISESMNLEDFPNALKELEQKLDLSKPSLNVRDYPKILFLGTGSCIPNKTRNTSGILLQASETKNILLDCGEGTFGQILRFFGPEESDRILTNVEAVYISHLHADHHIGLIGLLQGRREALNRLNIDKCPLYLFAPKQILAWLNFYDRCFESVADEYILVPNDQLLLNDHSYPEDRENQLLKDLELCDISTCFVRHCPNSFGVSLIHRSGYKITYSGDTMPSENLVELGKNSDILIHEATMEDELAKEAIIKMHSTTSQAIQAGKDMEAKNIILTHFSQRYAKLPRFNDNFAANVSIAFDNMQIKLDELPLVPLLYPALKIMFAEHYEELENKAVKRQLKSEREASMDRSQVKQKMS